MASFINWGKETKNKCVLLGQLFDTRREFKKQDGTTGSNII